MELPKYTKHRFADITEWKTDVMHYSYFHIDRPDFILFPSPLLFSCGAGQTKGSRLLRYLGARSILEWQARSRFLLLSVTELCLSPLAAYNY
ncbi:hypothetical protein BDR07DRAFT_1387141 [Suillus spraguei]|nr:hypothetical protein BDR07DRAFT_1387141 [Suillus spraguei]